MRWTRQRFLRAMGLQGESKRPCERSRSERTRDVCLRDGEVVWSLTPPTLASSSRKVKSARPGLDKTFNPADDGGKKSPVTGGRARRKTV